MRKTTCLIFMAALLFSVDALAQSVQTSKKSLAWFPTTRPQTQVALTMRPFLTENSLGGLIGDARVTYRFGIPVALDLSVSPASVLLADPDTISSFASHGFVSLDLSLFQVGVGVGVARFEPDRGSYSDGDLIEPAFGVSAAQFIRLGAVDGLNLSVTTTFVARERNFEFGGLRADLQVPTRFILRDSWAVVRGGQGLPSQAFGEVGLRMLVSGDGLQDSIFITPTVGGARIEKHVEDRTSPNLLTKKFDGPTVGVTLEWRP